MMFSIQKPRAQKLLIRPHLRAVGTNATFEQTVPWLVASTQAESQTKTSKVMAGPLPFS